MNFYVFSILFGVLAIATNTRAQEVNALLMDSSLVRRQIDCILGRSRCDIIGNQIIRVLPEALNNNCARCTAYQARNARRLMNFMRDNYPADWAQIVQRYRRNQG